METPNCSVRVLEEETFDSRPAEPNKQVSSSTTTTNPLSSEHKSESKTICSSAPTKGAVTETEDTVSNESGDGSTKDSSSERQVDNEQKPKPKFTIKCKRKRKRSRCNVNKHKVSTEFSVYLLNIRGAKSKLVSLQSIVDDPEVNPDVINLIETNLKKSSKLDVAGYKCFNRNRQNKHMGGVATLVRESDLKDTIKLSEGSGENEYMITRHSQFDTPLNIIVIYGEQESRSNKEDIEEKWEELMGEVKKIEDRGEACLLLGDYNKAVGDIIPGNNAKVSHGGSLVRQFLESQYVLVDSTTKTINGPFTRYDPSAPQDVEKKSTLDLVIVSKIFEKYIKEMKIDKDLQYTPFRSKAKSKDLVYPDHYAILISFENIPMNKKQRVQNGIRRKYWNTNKKDVG